MRSSEHGVSIVLAIVAGLAAYLFPYFFLLGNWWRFIPSTIAILLVGAALDKGRVLELLGLRGGPKALVASIVVFAILLPTFSYLVFEIVVAPPLAADPRFYFRSHVHQFFQVLNDEMLLRAALLNLLIRVLPYPAPVALLTATVFALGHHVLYRFYGVEIHWHAMVTLFSFAALANLLFMRYRHIGYGFAFHYAWNFYRFNCRFYLDGTPLSEGASFNYIEGDVRVALGAFVAFLFALILARWSRTLPPKEVENAELR